MEFLPQPQTGSTQTQIAPENVEMAEEAPTEEPQQRSETSGLTTSLRDERGQGFAYIPRADAAAIEYELNQLSSVV